VWECSTVNSGGFFLRYQASEGGEAKGLPEHLFAGGQSATLTLLALVGIAPGARRFHNCALVRAAVDPEEGVLFSQSARTRPVQSIAPGHLGLRLVLPEPPFDPQSGADELLRLYQLLGLRVLEGGGFRASREGLPIGPAEDDPARTDDDGRWIYERVLPVHRLAQARGIERRAGLPSPDEHPYAGVGDTLSLAFDWQDVYGNRLTNGALRRDVAVRYADRLLGINQWPTVAESYAFEPAGEGAVRLVVELVFDQAAYVGGPERTPEQTREITAAARATYEQVYHQVHRADVTFSVRTSALPGAAQELSAPEAKRPLTDFVDAAYRYLTTAERLLPVEHQIAASDTLATVAQAHLVALATLAAAHADTPDLFAAGTVLRLTRDTGEEPLTHTVRAGDTLRAVAELLDARDEARLVTAALVAEQNAGVALNRAPGGLRVPGRVRLPAGLSAAEHSVVSSGTGRTLAQIAEELNASLASGRIGAADLAIANQHIPGLIRPGVEIVPAGATPESLSAISSPNLNVSEWGIILAARARLRTRPNETFATIAGGLAAVLAEGGRTPARVPVADVAALVGRTAGLLADGRTMLRPPLSASLAVTLSATTESGERAYPPQLLFPLTAEVEMARGASLVDTTLAREVPEIARVSAYLTPRAAPIGAAVVGEQEQVASLRAFAERFQQAFPELHLALGDEYPHKRSQLPFPLADEVSRPLWAVRMGAAGIDYNIGESFPFFFSPAPLANTLLSGAVEVDTYSGASGLDTTAKVSTRVEALDINVLARDFLAAIENFLEPASAVPAAALSEGARESVHAILEHKRTLASAIAAQVTHILAQTDGADISARRDRAAELLRQQLLIDLAEAYDIETLVQYNVEVTLAREPGWGAGNAARLAGQPVLLAEDEALRSLSFTLSPARIPLTPAATPGQAASSSLTFFFNTRTPERLRAVTLPLAFRVTELEYDIVDVPGGEGYQASSWLTFILPLDPVERRPEDPAAARNYIGDVTAPIPLRTAPVPPSLVLHRVEADPDSLEELAKIREWQYTYVYESLNLEVAQDRVESSVTYNAPPPSGVEMAAPPPALFGALVNFATVYPQLLPDLQALAGTPDAEVAGRAVAALESLVGRVAQAWREASARPRDGAARPTVHRADYVIAETGAGEGRQVRVTRADAALAFPLVTVPRFRTEDTPPANGASAEFSYTFAPKTPEEAARDPVFGESSIPDRVLSIPNLDIVNRQSAWGAIWLARNKELAPGRETNPAFVFQTPQIRFSTNVTPLLVNSERWYIDAEGGPGKLGLEGPPDPRERTLDGHLEALFATILPETAGQPYDVQVAVRYAFALASHGDEDLVSALPVTLSPRVRVEAGASMREATAALRTALARELQGWLARNRPRETKGMFVFSVAIFAHGANQPLLHIQDLRLRLESIAAGGA
jgi:hypothetical protein